MHGRRGGIVANRLIEGFSGSRDFFREDEQKRERVRGTDRDALPSASCKKQKRDLISRQEKIRLPWFPLSRKQLRIRCYAKRKHRGVSCGFGGRSRLLRRGWYSSTWKKKRGTRLLYNKMHRVNTAAYVIFRIWPSNYGSRFSLIKIVVEIFQRLPQIGRCITGCRERNPWNVRFLGNWRRSQRTNESWARFTKLNSREGDAIRGAFSNRRYRSKRWRIVARKQVEITLYVEDSSGTRVLDYTVE